MFIFLGIIKAGFRPGIAFNGKTAGIIINNNGLGGASGTVNMDGLDAHPAAPAMVDGVIADIDKLKIAYRRGHCVFGHMHTLAVIGEPVGKVFQLLVDRGLLKVAVRILEAGFNAVGNCIPGKGSNKIAAVAAAGGGIVNPVYIASVAFAIIAYGCKIVLAVKIFRRGFAAAPVTGKGDKVYLAHIGNPIPVYIVPGIIMNKGNGYRIRGGNTAACGNNRDEIRSHGSAAGSLVIAHEADHRLFVRIKMIGAAEFDKTIFITLIDPDTAGFAVCVFDLVAGVFIMGAAVTRNPGVDIIAAVSGYAECPGCRIIFLIGIMVALKMSVIRAVIRPFFGCLKTVIPVVDRQGHAGEVLNIHPVPYQIHLVLRGLHRIMRNSGELADLHIPELDIIVIYPGRPGLILIKGIVIDKVPVCPLMVPVVAGTFYPGGVVKVIAGASHAVVARGHELPVHTA